LKKFAGKKTPDAANVNVPRCRERHDQLIALTAGLVDAACGVVNRSRFMRISRFTILYLSPR
jgi:hypothetical protein